MYNYKFNDKLVTLVSFSTLTLNYGLLNHLSSVSSLIYF